MGNHDPKDNREMAFLKMGGSSIFRCNVKPNHIAPAASQVNSHTSVSIDITLTIIPLPSSSKCVRGVLGKERDHVAASGSQCGVQGRWDAQLNHGPEITERQRARS